MSTNHMMGIRKKNQELHLIFLTRRGHENEGETGSTQVPSRNVALLFCDLQVPPYRARINNMKGDNSLFNTRQMTHSFLDPRNFFLPYLTLTSTFVPKLTFCWISCPGTVKCPAKRQFCPCGSPHPSPSFPPLLPPLLHTAQILSAPPPRALGHRGVPRARRRRVRRVAPLARLRRPLPDWLGLRLGVLAAARGRAGGACRAGGSVPRPSGGRQAAPRRTGVRPGVASRGGAMGARQAADDGTA